MPFFSTDDGVRLWYRLDGPADQATPPADGRFVAERVPDARYVELAAAHLSNVEAAGGFSEALVTFLTDWGE